MRKRMSRTDDIGFGGLKLLQDPEGFCYGVDAVLLAGHTAEWTKRHDDGCKRLCDLGTGNGIVPLILSHKTGIQELKGVELLEENWELSLETAEINDLSHRLDFVHGDVRSISPGDPLTERLGGPGSFHIVTANPPYFRTGGGETNENRTRSVARHEVEGTLKDFLSAAQTLLKDKGSLFMIHRPERLADIFLCSSRYGLEPKRMKLYSGHEGETPNLVVIEFVKGGGRQLTVFPQGYVREANGTFSGEVFAIYEKGNQ